ncbi:MAG: hypothetical protein PQJ59_07190 [Spirochaetales bacterium]|nr:hypothetical protein [Spirochaetales bacterium]
MKLWIRNLFKDFLALTILLSLFYFAGMKYLDLVRGKIRGAGDPIGIVSDLTYYPKRQFRGEDYTFNLSHEDDLYEGDLISSDSFSSIHMNLVDGTDISLEHGSSVILNLGENTIYFSGTISALSTQAREEPLRLIDLDNPDSDPIILSQSTEITLSTDESGLFSMSVLAGLVTRGEAVIKENEQFILSSTGDAQVNRLNYVLDYPPNNSHWISFEETQKIPFSWSEPNPGESRSLWIALDTSFEHIIYRKDDLDRLDFELDLLPGDYFWRVGNEEMGDFSSTGKFKITENLPLTTVLPTDEAELTYRDQLPGQNFAWRGTEEAAWWELELSRFPDMTGRILSERTGYNQIQIHDIEEGEYWWRITAHYDNKENVNSLRSGEPQKLTVTHLQVALPPQLITPEHDEEVTPIAFSEGIRFSWKGDPEIFRYRIILSSTPDMSDIVIDEISTRNYLNLAGNVLPGAYYWQVQPLPEGDSEVQNSEIRSLLCREKNQSLELVYPQQDEAVILGEGTNLVFRWKSSEKGNYRFRLWQVNEGADKLISNTTVAREENSQYIGQEGDYLWQVDLLDDKNRVLLEGIRLPFSLRHPLLPPQLISPLPASKISLIGEESLPLSWTNVKGADSYTGRLYYEESPEALLSFTDQKVPLTSVDISLLKAGDYRMELSSNREDEGKGFPTESSLSSSPFTIEDIVIYAAPGLESPRPGYITNRLDLLREGLNISWTSAYAFPSYEVVLKQKDSGILLMRRVTNQYNYVINDIYPDDYLIEVRGMDSKGGFSPIAQSDVSVLAVEPLAPVTMIKPERGDTVDMSHIDHVEFQWEQVEEGEKYNIALYDIRGNALMSLDNYSKMSYIFSDLSKLDVGEFIFTVEAVKDYNEIGIVRTSPETRISFTITLDTIGEAPVILSPKIQYAD